MKPKKFSINDRLKSFTYAFNGIIKFFTHEHNARIHLFAICIVMPLGWYFRLDLSEWSLIIIAIALVIITELLNTSLETLSDLVEPNFNKSIGDAKDYAAGATLVAAIVATILGGIVFIPKILNVWTSFFM